MSASPDIVICGAGIAGVTTAYQLAVIHGVKNILLVDSRPPLTLTSDKSQECYRNWWPGPGDDMVQLMNRSIDLLEEMHRAEPNRLKMHRRGYMYATADPARVEAMLHEAKENTSLGAGELRIHRGEPDDPVYVPSTEHGIFDAPGGADLFLGQALIQQHFPYVTERALALLHTRRCGWFAAQQFGMYMFEEAVAHGVEYRQAEVTGFQIENNRITGVRLGDTTISTRTFVLAAGPYQRAIGQMMGVEIPVVCEPHIKVMLRDPRHAFPRELGLFIWNDPVKLRWTDEECEALAESDETRFLVDELPVGVHGRPEGEGDTIILQWDYQHVELESPVYPIVMDPQLPEVALRGMSTVIPGLTAYLEQIPRPFMDGGYYTRTPENRPLIGPLPVDGAFIIGGLGGFGMQAACGSADLLAQHILGKELPSYAPAFRFDRYADPDYQKLLQAWGGSGQI